MTENELLDGIVQREGGYQEDPQDRGNANQGATNFGITSKAWGIYLGLGRQATRAEMKALTIAQAHQFYRDRYILHSPFLPLQHEPLRVQMMDFAINSGTALAIRWLQRTLEVPVSGWMDDRTVKAANAYPGGLVNKAVCCARLFMLDWATDPGGSVDAGFEEGLESRALSLSGFVRS